VNAADSVIQIHFALVKVDRIVRSHEPSLSQLFRMHVDEQRGVLTPLERLLADDVAQMPAGAFPLGCQKQELRRRILRQLAAHERFVCEQQASLDLDDRLEHHLDVVDGDRTHSRRLARLIGITIERPVQAIVGHLQGPCA